MEPDNTDNTDNIRNPIPIVNMRLDGLEPLNDFVNRIITDPTLETEMKQIMIQSRIDFLGLTPEQIPINIVNRINRLNQPVQPNPPIQVNHVNQVIHPIQNAGASNSTVRDQSTNVFDGLNMDLLTRTSNFSDFINSIKDISNPKLKKILRTKTEKFISTGNKIRLDCEDYELTIEHIDKLGLDPKQVEYIKKKIIPYDENALIEYRKIIELSKEEEKIKHELKIQRDAMIETRLGNVSKLNNIFGRLSYSPAIKQLKEMVKEHIDLYCDLTTDTIELNTDLYNQTVDMINSFRTNDKELLISLLSEKN